MARGKFKGVQRFYSHKLETVFLQMSPFLVIESKNIRAKGTSDSIAPNPEAGREFGDVLKATQCVPSITSTRTIVF